MPLFKYIVVTDKDINKIIKKNERKQIIYKNITSDIEVVKKPSDSPPDSENSQSSENKSKTDIIDKILELEKYTLDILKEKQCKKSCLPRLKSCCNGNNLNVDI